MSVNSQHSENSVVICNTAWHVLLAYSLVQSEMLNPRSTALIFNVEINDTINWLLGDFEWCEQVKIEKFKLSKLLGYYSSVEKKLRIKNGITLFLGNDYQIENQVLRKILSPRKVVLLDDGIANFAAHYKKLNRAKILLGKFLSIVFLKGSVINFIGVGYSSFEKRVSVFDYHGDFKSFQKIELHIPVIESLNLFSKNGVLLLGQPISEYSVMSFDEEMNWWKLFLNDQVENSNELELVYKPHPSENKELIGRRLKFFSDHGYNISLINDLLTALPVETISKILPDSTKVISLYSTALLTMKGINPGVTCIHGINSLISIPEFLHDVEILFRNSNVLG